MYEVGDVLYIVSNKRKNVIPVQVVEQILRKSLEGENISFKVVIPGKPQEPVNLHAIDGTAYKTLEDAKKVLYDQATDAINGLLEAAFEISKKHFRVTKKEAYREEDLVQYSESPLAVDIPKALDPVEPPSALLDFTAATETGEVKVQMPDGTYASVKMPVVE